MALIEVKNCAVRLRSGLSLQTGSSADHPRGPELRDEVQGANTGSGLEIQPSLHQLWMSQRNVASAVDTDDRTELLQPGDVAANRLFGQAGSSGEFSKANGPRGRVESGKASPVWRHGGQ